MPKDFKNLFEQVQALDKELKTLIKFIDKDEFSNKKIIRKKLDVTQDAKFTGSQFELNTTKIGFFSVTPVVQQTDIGNTSFTTVSGTGDDATINSNFNIAATQANKIRAILQNIGITG